MKIIPSLASANQICLQNELIRLGENFENLHMDIEDGNFVPNISFGLKTFRAVREITNKPFSVHLMVTNPKDYLPALKYLNCSHIFVHTERNMYLRELIYTIKSFGAKAGIALNPISNISDYQYLYSDLDAVLYLTSEPDYMGEIFNPLILKKIEILSGIETWVDGGIECNMLKKINDYGVDYAVMGRTLFSMDKPQIFLSDFNASAKVI